MVHGDIAVSPHIHHCLIRLMMMLSFPALSLINMGRQAHVHFLIQDGAPVFHSSWRPRRVASNLLFFLNCSASTGPLIHYRVQNGYGAIPFIISLHLESAVLFAQASAHRGRQAADTGVSRHPVGRLSARRTGSAEFVFSFSAFQTRSAVCVGSSKW